MKSKEVIDFFGGPLAAAKALGLTRQAVWKWGDEVPSNRLEHVKAVMELERVRRRNAARERNRAPRDRRKKKAEKPAGPGDIS